jgi:hypothetical protein
MEGLSSSETSVLTRATRRNKPENAILHTYSPSRPVTGTSLHLQIYRMFVPHWKHTEFMDSYRDNLTLT